jgi:hypothetical protein
VIALTVQEMLDELVLKYPHSYTNTQVVNRFDRLQKRIFRNLNTLGYDNYSTTPSTALGDYTFLTSSYQNYQIRRLLIDDIEYPYWTPEEDKPARFWFYMNNNIYIFPDMTGKSIDVEIWYYKKPTDLSAGSLAASPDLLTDYHMLLVYGVAKEIAEDMRDGSMATAFAVAYNDLFTEMMQSYQNPETYVVKEIPWG